MKPLNWIPAPWSWIAPLVAGALVVVIIMTMGAKIGAFISDPFGWVSAGHAQDRAGNIQGQHGKAADDAAQKATSDAADRKETRDKLTKETRDDILGQKDAGADAGDTGLAQLRGLCRRNPHDPSCARLQRTHPAQP